MNNDITTTGQLTRVVFENPDDNFIIAKFKEDNTGDEYSLKGIIDGSSKNFQDIHIKITGTKGNDRFGKFIKFNHIEVNESPLFMFISRYVKGLGRKQLREIFKKTKEEDLEKWLDERNSDELCKLKGVGSAKASKLIKSWHDNKANYFFKKELSKYDATPIFVSALYNHYVKFLKLPAEIAVKKILDNPYIVVEIDGIGFTKADKFAISTGVDRNSKLRIKEFILYVLYEDIKMNGSTMYPEDIIYNLMEDYRNSLSENEKDFIELPDDDTLGKYIQELVNESRVTRLIEDGDVYITTNSQYHWELQIYDIIKQRVAKNKNTPIVKDIDKWIFSKEAYLGQKFSQQQKRAIKLANLSPNIMVLRGYAGTGKTTISKMIIELHELAMGKRKTKCCALSGIASDRIRKKTSRDSNSIASTTVRDGTQIFYEDTGLLVVDESSMVDTYQFAQLLSKTEEDVKILLVGDTAQLPPIGAGDVFKNIVDFNFIPSVELTTIYRTAKDAVINDIANDVRRGKMPQTDGDFSDYTFIKKGNVPYSKLKRQSSNDKEYQKLKAEYGEKATKDILTQIIATYREKHDIFSKAYYDGDIRKYIYDTQIIIPLKRGDLGSIAVNKKIQETFNPQSENSKKLNLGFIEYHFKDKVIHIKNDNHNVIYGKTEGIAIFGASNISNKLRDIGVSESELPQRRIFNGMMGMISAIDHENEMVAVYFPSEELTVFYNFLDFAKKVDLGYVITIHKSQGSEYDNLIMPVSFKYFIMLNNQLLYTAITRASKHLTIIGDASAFYKGVETNVSLTRRTVLEHLFYEEMPI